MNKYVYLFELDSVRRSKWEIINAQQTMFKEIVDNGNKVILSYNQITDSYGFLCALNDAQNYESIIELFKLGYLKIARFGHYQNISMYIQEKLIDSIEANEFIFSALPIKGKDDYSAIYHALQYADLTQLKAAYDKEKNAQKKEDLNYIINYVKMIIILSLDDLAHHNMAQNDVKSNNLLDYYNKISELCRKVDFTILYGVDNGVLMSAFLVLDDIKGHLIDINNGHQLVLNRSNWIPYFRNRDAEIEYQIAQIILDLMYNYTVENSINQIAKRYENIDDCLFEDDFILRFNQSWQLINSSKNTYYCENIIKAPNYNLELPKWDAAVRLLKQIKVENNYSETRLYQADFEEQRSKWQVEKDVIKKNAEKSISKKVGIYFLVSFLINIIIEGISILIKAPLVGFNFGQLVNFTVEFIIMILIVILGILFSDIVTHNLKLKGIVDLRNKHKLVESDFNKLDTKKFTNELSNEVEYEQSEEMLEKIY